MNIHTVKNGETVDKIAEIYGVSADQIRSHNGLPVGEPAVGEELLVLIPTRTYTVKRGDTPERISLRFGVGGRELMAQNPFLCDRAMAPGDRLALKYGEPKMGMGVANGCFYKGCSIQRLKRVMPYLTYITVACGTVDGEKITRLFDDTEVLRTAEEYRKIPLMRIYDSSKRDFSDKDTRKAYAEMLINAVCGKGYRGIVLSEREKCEGYGEFLVELRKQMIGCDLILLTEISETSPSEMNEYADGSILSYDKYAMESPSDFKDGERKTYADFACDSESSKTFISLPTMAKWGRGFCTIIDALATARHYGCEILRDEDTLLCSFCSDRRGTFVYNSLKSIEKMFELINEFGYMGISFDIMRTPTAHLMMYNNLFRTAYHGG